MPGAVGQVSCLQGDQQIEFNRLIHGRAGKVGPAILNDRPPCLYVQKEPAEESKPTPNSLSYLGERVMHNVFLCQLGTGGLNDWIRLARLRKE